MKSLLWYIGIVLAVAGFFLLVAVVAIRLSTDRDSIKVVKFVHIPEPVTRYPVVLHHGFYAITTLHKFARRMRDEGIEGYSTQISASNTVAARARELALQIDRVLAFHEQKKVNIIAHSMGGLDARYLISALRYGDRVASLTTIATPHRGTTLANYVDLRTNRFFNFLANLTAAAFIAGTDYDKVDFSLGIKDMRVDNMIKNFNHTYFNDRRVYYRSYAGSVEFTPGGVVANPLLRKPYKLIKKYEGDNDGIVSIKSAMWGDFRGVIDADHYQQIGSVYGFFLQYFPKRYFNPEDFYLRLARDLGQMGF